MTTAYSAEQYDQNYPPGIERHFWNRARNLMIADRLRHAGLAGKRMLEIGCGTGVVVSHLRAEGMECRGCELGTPRIMDSAVGFVATGTDATLLPETERLGVEVLLLCDVIEHVPDPVAFLSRLAMAFPNARHLLVTVPARMEAWSNYDDHFGHFRRYDMKGLKDELAKAGFGALTGRYAYHALYVAMVVMNRLGMKRSLDMRAPRLPLAHRTLAAFCYLESRLMPARLHGSSVIAVATRSGCSA